MLHLPEAMTSTLNILIFLDFRWWQQMLVRGIAACGCGSKKIIPTPRIQVCPSDPNFPINLCKRRFLIKRSLAVTINQAEGRTLNYITHCLGFPCPVTFSLFSSLDNVAVENINGDRQVQTMMNSRQQNLYRGVP